MEMKIIDIDKISCDSFGDSPVEGVYIKCTLLAKIFKDNNVPEWFDISEDSVKFSGDVYWNNEFSVTPPKTKIEIVTKMIDFIKEIAEFDDEVNYDSKKLIKELKEKEKDILEDIENVEWAQFLQARQVDLAYDVRLIRRYEEQRQTVEILPFQVLMPNIPKHLLRLLLRTQWDVGFL